MTFFLCSIKLVYYIYWFSYVEPPLHAWHKSHFIMVYNLFNRLSFWVASILVRIFALYIHKGYWLVCSNLVSLALLSVEIVTQCYILLCFLTTLRRVGVNSLNICTHRDIWFWAFLCGEIFNSFSLFAHRSVQVFCFFLSQIQCFVSRSLLISFWLSNLLVYNCSQSFLFL